MLDFIWKLVKKGNQIKSGFCIARQAYYTDLPKYNRWGIRAKWYSFHSKRKVACESGTLNGNRIVLFNSLMEHSSKIEEQ